MRSVVTHEVAGALGDEDFAVTYPVVREVLGNRVDALGVRRAVVFPGVNGEKDGGVRDILKSARVALVDGLSENWMWDRHTSYELRTGVLDSNGGSGISSQGISEGGC